MNKLQSGISKTIISSILAFSSGCQHLGIDIRKPRFLDELVVNTSNSFRTITRKAEEQGINEMRQILEDSFIEEAWVFIPETNEWHEIGFAEFYYMHAREIDENTYAPLYQSGTVLAKNTIRELAKKHNALIIYHTHPSPSRYEKELISVLKRQGRFRNGTIIELDNSVPVYNSIPSESDIATFIMFSKEFYRINPSGNISSNVCSSQGIASMTLTQEGRDYFKDKNLIKILDIAELYVLKAAYIPKENLKRVVDGMSDSLLKVQFIPHLTSSSQSSSPYPQAP